MNRSDPPSFLKVAQRPQNAYEDLEGQKIELDALTPQSMIYVHKCKNSELTLEKKAMKVVVDGCNDCVFSIKSTPMTGMVEFVNCENIVLNIIGEVMIWTLTVDGSKNFKVNAENDNQFESIYIHHCPDFVVSVGKDNPTVVPINMDEPDRQYIIHYEIQGETKKLVAEKVIRDGIYPTTEKALAEAIAKEKEFSEKMATMMVDSIKITKKPDKNHKPKASPRPDSKPATTKPKPQPQPSAPNIKDEDEKTEYFENEADLSLKLDTLAQWIKDSNHCIIFTGAGISTSTGIPDFRSGMNTVLKTGPGVWELRDKGAARSASAKVVSTLKAIPSVGHMAIVKLHQEGLVKYTVSQNVDGLHLRSGIHSDQLAELHGNTNLETCTKCGNRYMRDFNTRNARGVYDHVTGRLCDDPVCKGQLVDSIINFGESLPAEELDRSFQEARKSDLCLVLGSSLRVNPAAEIPAIVARNGQKVVICNLQKTPLNPYCAMELHAQIDDVMIGVMKRLGLEIPKFTIKRRLAVDISDDKICFYGLDATKDTPYSFLREMEVTYLKNDHRKDNVIKKTVLPREPYVTSLPEGVTVPFNIEIILRFQGHYGEPDLAIKETFSSADRAVFELSYEVRNGGPWKVIRN